MYFPIDWPSVFNSNIENGDHPIRIRFNRGRTFFVIISKRWVYLWKYKPCLLLSHWEKDPHIFRDAGDFVDVVWKPDSTQLCLSTSEGRLLFISVVFTDKKIYSIQLQGSTIIERFDDEDILNHNLQFTSSVNLRENITSITGRGEDIVVATAGGWLEHILWSGCVDLTLSFDITKIPFAVDLETTRSHYLEGSNLHVVDVEASLPLGGFAFVLGDGRGGFLAATSSHLEPTNLIGLLAKDVKNACCVAINHRYQLITFGCENSQGITYCFDDLTGGLIFSHQFTLPVRDFPDLGSKAGPVLSMSWSPDGCSLCLIWQNGGMAVWSVFGSLLMCSLSDNVSFDNSFFHHHPVKLLSLDWGLDGYKLLMIPALSQNNEKTVLNNGDFLSLSFAKSVLTVNPCMPNHKHLILQADDCLHFNTGDMLLHQSAHSQNKEFLDGSIDRIENAMSPSMLFSNRHWQTIQVPGSYINSNWPIRYTAVDSSGNYIAIAGKFGYAFFSFPTRKWKLFGSERQERSVSCRGGCIWWNDFLIVACLLNEADTSEVLFHQRKNKLDVETAQRLEASAPIICINTFSNILLIFTAECQVVLYKLESNYHQLNKPMLLITKISETSLIDYVPHPLTVISIFLTSLRNESGATELQHEQHKVHSMIVNVGGRILMLQREKHDGETNNHRNKINFHAPVILASCVENVWYMMGTSSNLKRHFSESLWLGCGVAGMKAWLPLFPIQDGSKQLNFLSKRIMLHFSLSVYPLALLFEDAIILGVNSDEGSTGSIQSSINENIFPFYTLERTTQVFLPHILRQLLRRNLGVHALTIASGCTNLPYFTHVLELMLHEVLEREATASEPIPDPLLPRIVAFVQEFPQYLETVCHCARKTEVALWSHLFSVVGNPLTLFKECLQQGKLNTAATYLIILQNLAHPSVSRQNATLLLEAALDEDNWKLCKDLVRFLRAIGKGDPDSPPRTPIHIKPYHPPSLHTSNSVTSEEGSTITSPLPMKLTRTSSITRPAVASSSTPTLKERQRPSTLKLSRTASLDKFQVSASRPITVESCEQFYTDMVLSRHARKLLTWLRIRDLGKFCAHVEFDMVAWFTKERFRAACVDDYVEAITILHRQFNWPFPISRTTNGPDKSSRRSSFQSTSSQLCSSTPTTPKQALSHSNNGGSTESVNAFLTNHKGADDMSSVGGIDVSTCSSMTCSQDDLDRTCDSSWANDNETNSYLQPMGPKQAEAELRYLQDVFGEARCVDWCILVCLVLNDASFLIRVTNKINTFKDLTFNRVKKIMDQLSMLQSWASTYYPSYIPLVNQVHGIADELMTSCANDTIKQENTPTHEEIHSSTITNNVHQRHESVNSISDESIEEADEDPIDLKEGEITEDSNYECIIS